MRKTSTKILAMSALAYSLMALTMVQGVNAGEFQQTVSGAFVPSNFDTNEDGNPGVLYSAGARGTFGKSTFEGLLEATLLPAPVNCGPDQEERQIIVFSIVQRFNNGDLLFSSLADGGGISCASPGQRAPFAVRADITGGTGRFEGATGSYEFVASTALLLRDIDGSNVLQAARFGEITGTIELSCD